MQSKTGPSAAREGAVVQYAEIEGTFGYVYAIGKLRATFPTKDVEKEYQQLLTPADMSVPTEEQRLYNVLSRPENIFLAREMAWILEIQDVATYLLHPRSPVELQAMLEAINPDDPTQVEYDVIIGAQEPLAGGGGADLPTVVVNRLYHFTAKSFIESIPLPANIGQMTAGPVKDQAVASFRALVLSIFQDMLQLADNTGDAAEHRALNYVSLNYPDIYALKWQTAGTGTGDMVFNGVDVQHSPLSNSRQILDVIFKYTNSTGVIMRYYTSVDVTGQFPFLVTKLQPYFER